MLEPGCVLLCPGCDHRDLSPAESRAQKERWLADQLAPWSECLDPLQEALPEERLGYRERTTLHARWDGLRWQAGLTLRVWDAQAKRGFRTDLIAIPSCPVHSKLTREAIEGICVHLPGPPALDLAFVVVSGRILTLVLRNRELPLELRKLFGADPALDPSRLGLTGVFANLNPSAGKRVQSNSGWHLLWGQESSETEGLVHGPRSFQQLIPRLFREALTESSRFLAPKQGDCVVDLYSGVGASVVGWQKAGAYTIGVELGGEASHYLAINAGADATLRGRASERIPQLNEWLAYRAGSTGARLAFVNPPRTGLEPEIVDWLGKGLRPARLAYLSCSAGTLARDLRHMNDLGYTVQRIIPYDFFPRTRHVETLVFLKCC